MAGRFTIRSRRWDIGTLVASVLLLVIGFGGLFAFQADSDTSPTPVLLFVIGLGVGSVAFFAGPALLHVVRRRRALVWIRSHLYLPILALVAAFVHATVVPFRSALSSGKVVLLLGILVAIGGVGRRRLIAKRKAALNATVAIAKLTTGQPRAFRRLVADYTDHRAPLSEIEASMAAFDVGVQERWKRIKELPPRAAPVPRHHKVWQALQTPLTAAFFVVLAFHIWDELGGTQRLFGDEQDQFASAAECGTCHSTAYDEWAASSMGHAQTSSIMEAQLAVTMARNQEFAADHTSAKSCINCHAQIGARFAEDADALLPFDSGGDAAQTDGVGCIVCHTQASPPPEGAGTDELAIDTGSATDDGTMYGPRFEDPNPLPVLDHGMGTGVDDYFDDHLASSALCGSCHNVEIDLRGGDVVQLSTTFDEWQDYVAGFDEVTERHERADFPQELDAPLGCVDCHMPTEGDGTAPVVDRAPGLLPRPEREHRSHSFVGVDYALEPGAYDRQTLERVLAERAALLASAVTLEVDDSGPVSGDVLTAEVRLRNNLLGHSFPTGFGFLRQFWLEVSAETVDGEEVCLLPPAPGVSTPCESGLIGDGFRRPATSTTDGASEDLRQCDLASVGEILDARPDDLLNGDIEFAAGAAFPADDCDPWLTNFQTILTDGDLDDDGVFTEVPFHTFAPDTVQTRGRVASQTLMTELVPDGEEGSYSYDFDTSSLREDTVVVVTARLRFRHVPPYFLHALQDEQEDLGDAVPAAARIDAEKLLDNLVITDVVEATSGDGAQLACADGAQNRDAGTIFDCLPDDLEPVGAMPSLEQPAPAAGDPGPIVWSAVALALIFPVGVRRLRGGWRGAVVTALCAGGIVAVVAVGTL